MAKHKKWEAERNSLIKSWPRNVDDMNMHSDRNGSQKHVGMGIMTKKDGEVGGRFERVFRRKEHSEKIKW